MIYKLKFSNHNFYSLYGGFKAFFVLFSNIDGFEIIESKVLAILRVYAHHIHHDHITVFNSLKIKHFEVWGKEEMSWNNAEKLEMNMLKEILH